MTLIYETDHFIVDSQSQPHVARSDGGHLIIFPKVPIDNRWEFNANRAKALMRISMMVGEAMIRGLNERGVPVERLNFQDNGNWAIGSEKGPKFHLHVYGRAKNSVNQTHGEALSFPAQSTRFYEDLEPLDSEDQDLIRSLLNTLAGNERYKLSTWGLDKG